MIIKYPKEPKKEHCQGEMVPTMIDKEPVKKLQHVEKPHSFHPWNHFDGDKRFVVVCDWIDLSID